MDFWTMSAVLLVYLDRAALEGAFTPSNGCAVSFLILILPSVSSCGVKQLMLWWMPL